MKKHSRTVKEKSPTAIAAPAGFVFTTFKPSSNAARRTKSRAPLVGNGVFRSRVGRPTDEATKLATFLSDSSPVDLLKALEDASFRYASGIVCHMDLRERSRCIPVLLDEAECLERQAKASQRGLEPEATGYALDAAALRYVAACLAERERAFPTSRVSRPSADDGGANL